MADVVNEDSDHAIGTAGGGDAGAPDDDAGGRGPGARGRRSRRWQWIKLEVLLALELMALSAFAFSRPVLDSFGRSPETFIARQATTTDIVVFGLAVLVLPALAAVAVGALAGTLGRRARWTAQVGLVGVLAGVGAWRMGQDQLQVPATATRVVLLGILAALLLALLRWWPRTRRGTATFLRFAGAASAVFLVQFLLSSPTGSLAFGTTPGVDPEVADEIAQTLDADPPPVVLVIFDALPTMSLLDGSGRIDAELYPNFAALADDATWYRNHTTVATFTAQAIPAILTGRFSPSDGSDRAQESDNLFTLLGGSYNLRVAEFLTQLCPPELCPRGGSTGVGSLLSDAVRWWRGGAAPLDDLAFELLAALGPGRHDAAAQWIEGLDSLDGAGPGLYMLHTALPHPPWEFIDDGTRYARPADQPTGRIGFDLWSSGIDVGRQRHLLQVQASDRLLGQLLDKLRTAGIYDDALVVVTADHGEAFNLEDRSRSLTDTNQAGVLWVPLLVKAPGQQDGVVSDHNVMTIDIVPTIAEELGIDIPWDVDGIPSRRAAVERHPDRKLIDGDELDVLQPAEGESVVEIDARDHFDEVLASDPVRHRGPDAIWKLTDYGELIGRSLAELTVGDPAAGAVEVDWPDGYDDIDLDHPLPLEVVASTDLAPGEVVAFALNGSVGAVGEVQDWELAGGNLVHGLIPPRLFVDGDNELSAHLVEGPVGDETLHPLDVLL